MRAAVLRQGEIVVRDDVPNPVPGFGQVLVEVKACGICGSDLHFAKHGEEMLALGSQMKGLPDMGIMRPDLSRDVFMGHEFAAEVLEYGPETVGPPVGSVVTSIPTMITMTGIKDLVYSNDLPCGYGERMLLSAPMLVEVPNGLDPRQAALTEPMAVGLHAVNKSGIGRGSGALVLGCGPVGLAVVAALSMRGVEPIVASDFSAGRRRLASAMGAHAVVEPPAAFDRPVPFVFECVGVPGLLNDVLRDAPIGARIVVVGVCMQPDTVVPFFGISKELSVQFVLGYDTAEFAESLRSIAEGELDVRPIITGEVGLDGVAQAFTDLANPDDHCKILVVP